MRELSVQGDSAALSSEPDCPTVAPSQSLSSCGPGVVVLASAALLPVPWMRSLLCLAFRDPYLDIGHPLIFQKPFTQACGRPACICVLRALLACPRECPCFFLNLFPELGRNLLVHVMSTVVNIDFISNIIPSPLLFPTPSSCAPAASLNSPLCSYR